MIKINQSKLGLMMNIRLFVDFSHIDPQFLEEIQLKILKD